MCCGWQMLLHKTLATMPRRCIFLYLWIFIVPAWVPLRKDKNKQELLLFTSTQVCIPLESEFCEVDL